MGLRDFLPGPAEQEFWLRSTLERTVSLWANDTMDKALPPSSCLRLAALERAALRRLVFASPWPWCYGNFKYTDFGRPLEEKAKTCCALQASGVGESRVVSRVFNPAMT